MSPPAHPPGLGPDMTIAQAALLRDVLLPMLHAATGDLTLDLQGVTDCDSSSVQLLLAARNSLQAQGYTLRLCAASPALRDALASFGLATLPGLLPALQPDLQPDLQTHSNSSGTAH